MCYENRTNTLASDSAGVSIARGREYPRLASGSLRLLFSEQRCQKASVASFGSCCRRPREPLDPGPVTARDGVSWCDPAAADAEHVWECEVVGGV